MPRTRRYKKVEKNMIQSIILFFKGIFCNVGNKIAVFFRVGRRKLTIMIVPHSQKKIINFQTNIFAMCVTVILLTGVISAFFWFNRQSLNTSIEIARLEETNKETRVSLDQLRDETNKVLQSGKKFKESLSQTLSLLGINSTTSVEEASVQAGDLSTIFNRREISQGTITETADLHQLSIYLEGAIQPIEEIGKLLDSQSTLFADIPGLWPLKNGIGHISMLFGQNIHPITGQWYIHKGLDISTWRSGDPIVATANGQVVTVASDAVLGNYVIIKHKHGFYTRYAHMSTIWVHTGDYVSQGHIIGTTGNSGVTTGPHLHYEVHIGADVVDPSKYMNITKTK